MTKPRKRTHRNTLLLIGLAILGVSVLAQPSLAFWGRKKSPEKQQQERLKKAVKEYNHGLDKMTNARKHAEESDSTFAFNYRATQNAKARKDYQRALERFDRALELNSEMHEAYSERGFCLRKLGRLPEAFAAYEKCLALEPDYAPAIEYRGESFLASNQPDSARLALVELERLARKNPTDTMFTAYQRTLKKAFQRYQLERFKKE